MKLSPSDVLRVMEEIVPFNRLLGMRGESVSEGRCVLRLPVRGELVGDPRRPAIHGGVISSLIDTAGGDLRAEAQLLRKGNRVCHVRVSVTQGPVLVAEGRAVYNVHRRGAA